MTPPGGGMKPSTGPHSRWPLVLLAIPVVTAGLFAWHSLVDLDIWFHLRAGTDLLDGGGWLRTNHYSFTEPGHPWLNHEWLFQVLTAWTGPPATAAVDADVQGWNVLRLVLTFLVMGSLLGGDGILRRTRIDSAVGLALACTGGLLLLWPRLTLRPELVSYILLIPAVRLIEAACHLDPDPARRRELGPPWLRTAVDPRGPAGRLLLLTIVWAQFHGFVSIVPGLVLLALVLAVIQPVTPGFATGARGSERHFRTGGVLLRNGMVVLVLVMAAIALTPNGVHGLLFPLRALGQFSAAKVDMGRTISELVPLMQTPNSLGLTLQCYWVGLGGGLVWIALTWGRVSLLRLAVFGAAAVAAWTNQRSVGVFGLSLMLLYTGYARSLPPTGFMKACLRIPTAVRAGTGILVLLVVPALLWPAVISDAFYLHEGVGRRFGAGLTPAAYPRTAARELETRPPARLFANIDAAAYLLAQRPGKIYIDGRTEAYSPELWAEFVRIRRADDQALGLLASRRVEAVCLATAGTAFAPLARKLLASARWQLAAAGAGGLLFVPPDTRTASPSAPPVPDLDTAMLQRDAVTLVEQIGRRADRAGPDARQADLCLAAATLFGFAADTRGQEDALRRGLAWRPDHPTLRHNLGNLLLESGRTDEALEQFQAALATNPRLAGSALNAGVCLVRLGKPATAIGQFRRAVAIDPRRFEAWANLGIVLVQNNEQEEGIRALERALEIQPDNAPLKRRLQQIRSGARRGAGR